MVLAKMSFGIHMTQVVRVNCVGCLENPEVILQSGTMINALYSNLKVLQLVSLRK